MGGSFRNGSRQLDSKTSFGSIIVSILKDRLSEFKMKLVFSCKRMTDTFEDMILKIAGGGLSREMTSRIMRSLYRTNYLSL